MTQKPVLIEADQLSKSTDSPDNVAPVPDLTPATAMQRGLRIAARKPSWFSRIVRYSIVTLLGMAISFSIWDFVLSALERNIWLGRFTMVLAGILLLAVVLFVLRELAGMARLSRIDRLQKRAGEARLSQNREAAKNLSDDLIPLYRNRDNLKLNIAKFSEQRGAQLDADSLLDLAETQVMRPLDQEALAQIEAASRTVAAATALVPLALADVTVALIANIRMVRRVAEIYGGRAGTLGSVRLLRAVATHLLATGAVAVGDDLIGSVAGGGALSKISRRFGEGVINGALTARVGIAAMDVCRPLPFAALKRPQVSRIVKNAVKGLFQRD